MTTVNNLLEAVKEIKKQLADKNFYMYNYRLLDGVDTYLDGCIHDEDFDEEEQIFNYLAYDLKWEERAEELFPMEL